MTDYTHLRHCLACGGSDLVPFFSMDDQPLANAFAPAGTELTRYPMGLNVCPACWHSQQSVAVRPDLMFDDYAYVSGTSQTLRDYFAWFAAKVYADFDGRPLRVLDIASNDGSLLAEFKKRGDVVLGIDPAANLMSHSKSAGVTTLLGYWDEATCEAVRGAGEPFDVIVAMNVLGHVARPDEFLKLCKRVLAPGGRIYVQTSQARMIERGEFDTAYHEHLSFFSIKSFRALADRCGLRVAATRHVPVHGTSYLIEMEPQTKPQTRHASSEIYATEMRRSRYVLAGYRAFGKKVAAVKAAVLDEIDDAVAEGYRVVGYGAAAKAVVAINHFGLTLDAMVDENPLKIGTAVPGTGCLVFGPAFVSALDTGRRVLWIIGAWNFRDEIVRKIKAVRPDCGDRFLTYFPEVSVTE